MFSSLIVDGLEGDINCLLTFIRWCLGWYIVVMLLLIGLAWDGRYNTYICRGSDRQIEPLAPDVLNRLSRMSVTLLLLVHASAHVSENASETQIEA